MNSWFSMRSWTAGGLVIMAICAGGCGPIWIVDPPAAERIAKQQNKPLFWYFKAWDSSQHRNMRMQVFSDPAVAKEMKSTVNCELEYSFFPDYRNRYGVRSAQVCIMCSPDGQKVGMPLYVNTVPSPEKFLEWLRETKQAAVPGMVPAGASPPDGKPPASKK